MSAPVLRYAITDRYLRPADECDPAPPTTRLLQQARRLHHLGVDFLQIREKDLSPIGLHTLAQALRQVISAGQRPRLLLNLGHLPNHATTLDTAVALRLDGLHLPATSSPALPAELHAAFTHARLPPPILSISAHTVAEVRAARATRLDLILFGPVFGKTIFPQTPGTHPEGQLVSPALGLGALAAAVHAAYPTPILALGGLTPDNTPAALTTGAAGVAGIRLFL